MIVLKEENLLAAGGVRKVYVHSETPNKCIKVDKLTDHLGEWGTAHELEYYSYLEEKRGYLDFYAVAKFHGTVETNQGKGAVFDLVRDEDTQEPSQTLYHVMCKFHSSKERDMHKSALREFRRKLLKDRILCRDLNPWNVVVQKKKDGNIQYVLIDGVGHGKYKKFGRFRIFVKMFRHLRRRNLKSYELLKAYCLDTKFSDTRWTAGPILRK
ncbi:YrbL family protein [Pseudovibrio sp. Tun.PSC04-5.I4]|uniref:YrbL family protein n=1 Tax=Pseudovibrio sp. Tun.PSC04-5.I4 TaxID=1798213 RepID=UPI000882EB38|nr:YrbL family protein [Pseudovibrio sp. Tun.PSC04-5.I4]SDQ70996.1 PhoP regulatory network protein YrbL [Pseudovibrio sp. Tun.PSC04-5.I4]